MAPIRCCFDQTAVWHSDAARGPSTPSFDHLVGTREQDRRDIETQGPCRLQVDHELELGPLLHRQVGWFCPFEDFVDEAAAIAAREAMKVASSSTKMASAGHARIDAKLGSKSSNPRTCKIR